MDPLRFYPLAGAAMLVVTALLSSGDKFHDFHRRALTVKVATRPSWLPSAVLVFVHTRPWLYLAICHGAPVLLLVASLTGATAFQSVRICLALCLSVYGLVESSVTGSHRDFANVYCAWCLALLDPQGAYAKACALGICVHFVHSSGVAKAIIAGPAAWALDGDCLGGILRHYGKLSLSEGGPGLMPLNRFLAEKTARGRILSATLATATLLFECAIVPLALALPARLRCHLPVHMVLLHVGIGLAQSAGIGLAFLPNIAAYVLGMGSVLHVSQLEEEGGDPVAQAAPIFAYCLGKFKCEYWVLLPAPWVVAGCLGLATPLYYLLRGRILPENWPLSPFALFAWSGPQWHELFRRFADGDTRLVLVTGTSPADDTGTVAPDKHPLVGCIPIPKFGVGGEWGGSDGLKQRQVTTTTDSDAECFDAWDVLLGETLVHAQIVEALFAAGGTGFGGQPGPSSPPWDAALFCRLVSTWLVRCRRLVALDSGLALQRCYFVRVNKTGGQITEVLAG